MGSGKWVGHDPSGAGWPGVWLVAGYPPRTAGTMAPGAANGSAGIYVINQIYIHNLEIINL